MTTADVVIAGGGVMGSSTAYHLAASPDFSGRIIVVERDSTYERASTPRSAGAVRQQFSNPENIEIGLFGYHFVTHVADYLSVDGEAPDLSWRENGFLFLASHEGMGILRENHAEQTRLGANIALLLPDEIAARYPFINTEDLAGGALGLSGEGWIDPNTLLQAFRRKARSLGVEYVEAEVASVDTAGGTATGVTLSDGSRIEAGTVVITAGAFSGRLGRTCGLDLPVAPKKRIIYVIDCRRPLEPSPPLTIDTNGVFFRPEGAGYICGVSPPEDRDPDAWDDLEIDHHWFEEVVWPTIAHRVPAFEAVKQTSAWAGWYDHNTFDHNALIGRHPEVANLLVATGFSGHGLQQSPAIGRAMMELITSGGFRTIDLTRFGIERLARGEKVSERNVV